MIGRGQPSQAELAELQQEIEQEREDRQVAQSLAQGAADREGKADDGYWDIIGRPDVAREMGDQQLEEFMKTEFSNTFALGNITRADWNSWQWQIENEFWSAKNEFKDSDAAIDDDDVRIMYGEDRPTLTNEKARRLRSAMQVKKVMTSLSINSRGLRSGTEIHAVAKTENQQEENDGRLSGIKGWMSG